MKTTMGPPPPRNPTPCPQTPQNTLESTIHENSEPSTDHPINSTTLSPPPLNPTVSDIQQQPQLDSIPVDSSNSMEKEEEEEQQQLGNGEHTSQKFPVPYTIPPWSEPPCHPFQLEVLKDGTIVHQLDVYQKGAYMFGRVDLCDFVLEHPTVSRFHAVLQFKGSGDAYIYDLGSTHGTYVNKSQVKKKVYVELHVGDVIRFGGSSRLYIFQGPTDLMLPEAESKIYEKTKIQEQIQDRVASLQRAKMQASLASGISWGMGEDAFEENEEDLDEVTWQTYKGQLTEKQEKTREKILKRTEKIAHMKKEIDAIRAKDISQGGLTQGQQTQIARNEQRMAQIDEELENLEETLNDSIRESLGARVGKISRGKKRGAVEDDDEEYVSDDDEFYDRTKKKSSIKKTGENQSIETADTLLDKKEGIMKQMNEKKELLLVEKNKLVSSKEVGNTCGGGDDVLDAFMSGLSSQLVLDKTGQIEKDLSGLQLELDRIVLLLKIADPSGEAVRKRELNIKRETTSNEVVNESSNNGVEQGAAEEEEFTEKAAAEEEAANNVYVAAKPQWLGAVVVVDKKKVEKEEIKLEEDKDEEEFIDYKDRKRVMKEDTGACGLIIRKRKQVETSQEGISSSEAEDAVALLLKHTTRREDEDHVDKTKKTKLLVDSDDNPDWVPPKGQSGDGRTSLNDRYGY